MNAVKVQYTVKESYVETNKKNIANVMTALRVLGNPDIKYSTFVLDDGQTFVHLVFRANDAANEVLGNLPEFQTFQQQLRASEPVSPPKPENLTLVDSGWDIF